VELRRKPGEVWMRDSKDPDGPRLRFSEDAFRAFVASLCAGDLARP
jgi:hypothetical protein